MKTAQLGDYLTWNGQLAKVICTTPVPSIGIQILEPNKCPHCQGELPPKQFDVIVSSPLFQENAEPIKTITE